MPRNSTGNYTLPLPPVVSGELIESQWANTSLDDIGQALTESLDRYGRGGMLAPFLFTDGTVSNPGAAWANAPGTGFFRDSSALHASWNGTEIWSFNDNGLTGLVSSLTAEGYFIVKQGGAFRWLDDLGALAWQMDVDTAENLYIYSTTAGVARLTLKPNGASEFLGGVAFPYAASNFIKHYLSDGVENVITGILDNGGTDVYGIYHDGTFVMSVNLANDAVTFANTVIMQNLFATQGGSYIVDWFRLRNAADDQRIHFQVNTSNGQLELWDTAYSNLMLTLGQTGVARFYGEVRARDRVYGMTDDGIRYGAAGVPNENGWPGIHFYWGGFNERHMGMTQSGDVLFWQGQSSTGNVRQSFQANGDIRAVRFVATPTPG